MASDDIGDSGISYRRASDPRHAGRMDRRVPGLPKKLLAQALPRLEDEGLAARRAFRVMPPKPDDEIAARGTRLHEPIARGNA